MLTRKTVLVFILTAALIFIAANIQAGWIFFVSSFLIAILVFSYLFAFYNLAGLSAERFIGREVFAGEKLEVVVRLLPGKRKRVLVKASDEFLGAKTDTVFMNIRKGVYESSRYTLIPEQRGVHEGGHVRLSSGGLFGLVDLGKRAFVRSPVMVYPRYVDLTNFPLLEAMSYPSEAVHERKKGAGDEYYGVREYRHGDSLRYIHWKSSANKNMLIVKEFEQGYRAEISLVLDSAARYNAGRFPDLTFEKLVSAAASIVNYTLKTGHPVNLYTYENEEPSVIRHPDWWQALDWLAGVKAESRLELGELLATFTADFLPRSTVIVLTTTHKSFDPGALLKLQGGRSRVILVACDLASYGSPEGVAAGEVLRLAAELLENRVNTYLIRKGEELETCLTEPLRPSSG